MAIFSRTLALTHRPPKPLPLAPEALARLAGGLAHELKNPLSTLGLQIALLQEAWEGEDSPLGQRSSKTLRLLQSEVGRLDTILRDFLRFAHTDTMEVAASDLNQIVEEVLAFARPEAERHGVQLDSYLDSGLPLIELDSQRIRQVILNLVLNARQALEATGGHISVVTRIESGSFVLEVVDDGPGMKAQDLARVFEPYYSTKQAGSGLGLPTAKRVAEAHGGELELESSPDHGTRARLLLPAP